MSTVQMPCCVCGKDVAYGQYITDQLGKHYCEPCTYNNRQADPAATTVAAPPQDAIVDDTPKAKCARCRSLLPETELAFVAGDLVCKACLSPSSAPASAAKRDPFARGPQLAEEPLDKVKFRDTLLGGAIISAAVLVGSFGIFFALYQAFPGSHIQNSAIAAFVRCIILLCGTAGLIVSMAIAAGIMGGINFGYFGSLVYKSIIVCLCLGIFNFFTDQNESIALICNGFRALVLLVALLALFKIDFFEAFLLAFVNSLLGWLLLIFFLGLMSSLGATGDNDFGKPDPSVIPNGIPADIQKELDKVPASTFPTHPFLNVPHRDTHYATIA